MNTIMNKIAVQNWKDNQTELQRLNRQNKHYNSDEFLTIRETVNLHYYYTKN